MCRVTEVEDEEYCLIPMGGVLPQVPQRILGNGGSAGMVHPSTGKPSSRRPLDPHGLVHSCTGDPIIFCGRS